jgi:hypothetical protein
LHTQIAADAGRLSTRTCCPHVSVSF